MTDTIYLLTSPAVSTSRRTYPAGARIIEASYRTREAADVHAAGNPEFTIELMSEREADGILDRGGIIYPTA